MLCSPHDSAFKFVDAIPYQVCEVRCSGSRLFIPEGSRQSVNLNMKLDYRNIIKIGIDGLECSQVLK